MKDLEVNPVHFKLMVKRRLALVTQNCAGGCGVTRKKSNKCRYSKLKYFDNNNRRISIGASSNDCDQLAVGEGMFLEA